MHAVLTQRLFDIDLLSAFIVWSLAAGFPRDPLHVDDSMTTSSLLSAEPSFMLVKSTQDYSETAWGQSGACLSDVGRALGALFLNGWHQIVEIDEERAVGYVPACESAIWRS